MCAKHDHLKKAGKGGAGALALGIAIHLLCHEVPMLIVGISALLQGGVFQ